MKLGYIDFTGELLLELLKKHNSNLPKDAKLVKVELNPAADFFTGDIGNRLIRYFIESDEYSEIYQGMRIPRKGPVFAYEDESQDE